LADNAYGERMRRNASVVRDIKVGIYGGGDAIGVQIENETGRTYVDAVGRVQDRATRQELAELRVDGEIFPSQTRQSPAGTFTTPDRGVRVEVDLTDAGDGIRWRVDDRRTVLLIHAPAHRRGLLRRRREATTLDDLD
jgi:hypothetical protein